MYARVVVVGSGVVVTAVVVGSSGSPGQNAGPETKAGCSSLPAVEMRSFCSWHRLLLVLHVGR